MRNHQSVARALDKVQTAASARGLVLAVEQVHMLGKTAARIVASHVPGEYTEEDFRGAVSRLYDDKASLVEGTVQDVSQMHATQSSMFVSLNTNSKPFSESAVAGMKVVTANVFADASDNSIWTVRGEGDARALVQQSSDDLSAILNARRSRMITTAGFAPAEIFPNGGFLMYFDTASFEPRYGFGIAMAKDDGTVGNFVLDRKAGDVREIEAAQVMSICQDIDHDVQIAKHEETAAFPPELATRVLDYWRKLYGQTAYFARLEQIVRSRSVMHAGS